MNIEELHWHDGNIIKIEILPNYGEKSQINIYAEIYDDAVRAPGRDAIVLNCIDVVRFNCSCDLVELSDNSGAGSINDFTINRKIARFYLFGGFIEIKAKSFKVEKC
jgi:hypothetical protein